MAPPPVTTLKTPLGRLGWSAEFSNEKERMVENLSDTGGSQNIFKYPSLPYFHRYEEVHL